MRSKLHFGRAETSLDTEYQTSLDEVELHSFDKIRFATGEVVLKHSEVVLKHSEVYAPRKYKLCRRQNFTSAEQKLHLVRSVKLHSPTGELHPLDKIKLAIGEVASQ